MTDWATKRRHRRVPFAFNVDFRGHAGDPGACQRIAAVGLHAYTPHVIPSGESTLLSFTLPDEALTRVVTSGRVLQSQPEDPAVGALGGMKVLFVDLDPHDEEAIRSFVLLCIKREEEYSAVRALSPEGRRVYSARFFGTETVGSSYVVDISEGGMYVRTHELPEVGEDVLADLYLPGAGAVTRVEAEIMWVRPHDPNKPGRAGCGLKFGHVPDETRDLIVRFVERFGTDEDRGMSIPSLPVRSS